MLFLECIYSCDGRADLPVEQGSLVFARSRWQSRTIFITCQKLFSLLVKSYFHYRSYEDNWHCAEKLPLCSEHLSLSYSLSALGDLSTSVLLTDASEHFPGHCSCCILQTDIKLSYFLSIMSIDNSIS